MAPVLSEKITLTQEDRTALDAIQIVPHLHGAEGARDRARIGGASA
ncbi:hypothetical protein [Mesorhizobium sp.]|nr:hypothetical protein [Mesorhizobium sp.]